MPLLHPGDTLPQLTLNIPGAQAIGVPGWFAGEFGVLLFNRGAWCPYCTAQLRAFQRAGDSLTQAGIRVGALLVDDETPPFAFVHIRGRAALSEDPGELLGYATEIGGHYMGAERAREFGRRNAAPGELLVRITPERVISKTDLAGY